MVYISQWIITVIILVSWKQDNYLTYSLWIMYHNLTTCIIKTRLPIDQWVHTMNTHKNMYFGTSFLNNYTF